MQDFDINLARCPFCGGKAYMDVSYYLIDDGDIVATKNRAMYQARCGKCRATSVSCEKTEHVIRFWNVRFRKGKHCMGVTARIVQDNRVTEFLQTVDEEIAASEGENWSQLMRFAERIRKARDLYKERL